MKNLLRFVGAILIVISVMLFLVGSVKTAKAEKEQQTTVELAPGITAVQEGKQEALAEKGFTAAAVFCVLGIVVILLSGRVSRR